MAPTPTTSTRPARRAKLANVDYAVLTSGQQIPEFSSDDESSDDEDFGARRVGRGNKRRRGDGLSARSAATASAARKRAVANATCFVCARTRRSEFSQCDICSRWFHEACRRTSDVRSVLANTSCHECLNEAAVSERSALPRPKLDTVQDLVRVLRRAKKILVVAGAGMSVSCGIPDFRSKDGIYEMVKHMDVAFPEPECLFHIDYFREDPGPFFQMVQNVFAHSPQPSPTHAFLKHLQDKGKLLRLYSQNVDGLEEAAGIKKYIPCHGSFAWSSCMRCHARVSTQTILPVIEAGVIPTCSELNCRGVLKPEITFFGEILSDKVSTSITKDRLEADLILVIGTSLKVSPVAEIPSYVPSHIPQVVINRTPLKKKRLKTDTADPPAFDLQLLGDCDAIVRFLCSEAGWKIPGASGSPKKPKLIRHKDLRRVCVGKCECEGVPDGALMKPETDSNSGSDADKEAEQIICDACSEPIQATNPKRTPIVYRCMDCFDYDLCSKCYKRASERHFGGRHEFRKTS